MMNHPVEDPKKSTNLVIVPRLGDRYYLKSVLTNVFGPRSIPYIRENIMANGQVFGGPCDEYEQVRTGLKVFDLADIETACPGEKSGSRLSQIPDESVIRLGYLFRTCDALVRDKSILNFAVKKAGQLSKNPTAENYFNIVRLFDVTADITNKDSEVFEKISSQDSYKKLPSEKQWQLLFGLTCKSTDWQVL